MAKIRLQCRADAKLVERLDAYLAAEKRRTGIEIERAAVIVAALETWIAAKEAKTEKVK